MSRIIKHIPERKCVCCNTVKKKDELIRIVCDGSGKIASDKKNILPGRGAYICNNEKCFDVIVKKNVLSRAFHKSISVSEHEKLREELFLWKKSSV